MNNEIKIPITEEDKQDLMREIQTYEDGLDYNHQEQAKLRKEEETMDRWIFEAKIKLRSFEKKSYV